MDLLELTSHKNYNEKGTFKVLEASSPYSMDSPLKLLFYCKLTAENSSSLSFALNAKDNSEKGKLLLLLKHIAFDTGKKQNTWQLWHSTTSQRGAIQL